MPHIFLQHVSICLISLRLIFRGSAVSSVKANRPLAPKRRVDAESIIECGTGRSPGIHCQNGETNMIRPYG